jgi:hypothetical protein
VRDTTNLAKMSPSLTCRLERRHFFPPWYQKRRPSPSSHRWQFCVRSVGFSFLRPKRDEGQVRPHYFLMSEDSAFDVPSVMLLVSVVSERIPMRMAMMPPLTFFCSSALNCFSFFGSVLTCVRRSPVFEFFFVNFLAPCGNHLMSNCNWLIDASGLITPCAGSFVVIDAASDLMDFTRRQVSHIFFVEFQLADFDAPLFLLFLDDGLLLRFGDHDVCTFRMCVSAA